MYDPENFWVRYRQRKYKQRLFIVVLLLFLLFIMTPLFVFTLREIAILYYVFFFLLIGEIIRVLYCLLFTDLGRAPAQVPNHGDYRMYDPGNFWVQRRQRKYKQRLFIVGLLLFLWVVINPLFVFYLHAAIVFYVVFFLLIVEIIRIFYCLLFTDLGRVPAQEREQGGAQLYASYRQGLVPYQGYQGGQGPVEQRGVEPMVFEQPQAQYPQEMPPPGQ